MDINYTFSKVFSLYSINSKSLNVDFHGMHWFPCFFNLKIKNKFLVSLGLCCCTWAFSNCGEWRLLFVAVRGLLFAVASLAAEHRL